MLRKYPRSAKKYLAVWKSLHSTAPEKAVIGLPSQQQVLRDILEHQEKYPFLRVRAAPSRTLAIDFSSPNIAKPFHAGHLRSTLLGNSIANMYEKSGHIVRRINYLGDWGTQCGIVLAGFEMFGSEEELQHDPLKHLLQVYVKGSQEDEKNPAFHDKVRSIFSALERGDTQLRTTWQRIRSISLDEYSKLYKKIGIEFDEVVGESQYADDARTIATQIREEDAAASISKTSPFDEVHPALDRQETVRPLLKSDGTSLYLSRDLAALLDRAERLDFDDMLYVVENGQHAHFVALFSLAERFDSLKHRNLRHVKFGRIRGLSTRKGSVVLLSDLIEEATNSMKERMAKSKFTRPDPGEEDEVALNLALSVMIVNDFRHIRTQDYEDARTKLQLADGDTGVFLQYTHARLCSLERRCGITLQETCSLDSLTEPEAQDLISHLFDAPNVIEEAMKELEPVHVVRYLFRIAHKVNRAMKVLRVKGEHEDVAQARLVVFHSTRTVMRSLMKTLGLRPLERM